ncbi:MAG: hypothetical protein CSA10_00010 [Cardiobacteriales bacterium]|nr:MAG: hypothetical protein CSA10_00010 [Cardiobacteriales bacterium]
MSVRQPIQYPVKFYSWLDRQAPRLEDKDGSIKTILKGCLVTGYGDKQGAGWAMPFEEDFAMVLRMPKRTGRPPDIKIENGAVINADNTQTVRHRISSYQFETCTGITDNTTPVSENILGRVAEGEKWYLFVTDFGFLFCHEYKYGRMYMNAVYVGQLQKLSNLQVDNYIASKASANDNGTASNNQRTLAHMDFMELNTAKSYNSSYNNNNVATINVDIGESYADGYIAQPILCDTLGYLPFYCSISTQSDNENHGKITLDKRPMFRLVNHNYYEKTNSYYNRVLYIPLDNWVI